MFDSRDIAKVIITVFVPLLAPILLDTLYTFFYMGYGSLKNIIAINTFTNVFFYLFLFLETELYVDNSYMFLTLVVFIFVLIPLAKTWFYRITDIYDLTKRRIKVHTYVATILSYGGTLFLEYVLINSFL